MKPQVSIVVPAFNESPEIIEQSLLSIAAQSLNDFECLVIDESTDPASVKACRDFCDRDARFQRVTPDRRLGLAASLNLGISMAKADLVARFDSDDICMPERLALQVTYMQQHPDVGVLGGKLELMDESGKTLAFREYPYGHDAIERRFQTTTPIAHPTVMMRRILIFGSGC
jgi:glycosyltransferase involved in cell wall biosynthesis